MTDEQKENIRNVMLNEWADEEKREKRINNMRESANKRRIHTDITAHQLDGVEAKREYMREYQRKYRQLHPNYYKKYHVNKKLQ